MINDINLVRDVGRHLIIEGTTGIGKTVQVLEASTDIVGRENVFSYRGHSRTESIDLLGMYVRYEDTMVFIDGPLTAAFNKAKDEKVILVIDEIGRIPDQEKDMLVGCLSPDHLGYLTLDTGKGVKSGDRFDSEVIKVPKDNLTVIGTTNLGHGFKTTLGDEAFKERFIVLSISDDIDSSILDNASKHLDADRLEAFAGIVKLFSTLYNEDKIYKRLNYRLSELIILLSNAEGLYGTKEKIIASEILTKYVDKRSLEVNGLITMCLDFVTDKASIGLLIVNSGEEMDNIMDKMANVMGDS